MKAVILAGGLGTRISEETTVRPKPMIEIGGMPVLWHILKTYSHHGINDFIICLGYKGYMIKEYFANYFLHMSDVTFDMRSNQLEVHEKHAEPWRVTLVDTGISTQTGGRLKRVARYLNGEPFFFTYGDGVADIDITRLHAFHRDHQRTATVTGVTPPGRFGSLVVDGPSVVAFNEHRHAGGGLVNGGFFVFNRAMFDVLGTAGDSMLETQPMNALVEADQLRMYRHTGFWEPMDTLREYQALNDLWQKGNAPWRVWE